MRNTTLHVMAVIVFTLFALPSASAAGLGDLDGNAKDDVLMRHDDGRWHLYPMDGHEIKESDAGTVGIEQDRHWRIAGIGDLDGDGIKDEVLLRHAFGHWRYYSMDGRDPERQGAAKLSHDIQWRIAAMGDFNGDGKHDMMLRHVDGRWNYYPLDGGDPIEEERGTPEGADDAIEEERGPTSLTSDRHWRLAAVGDFNGDGCDDVLLRHVGTGRWSFVALDGRTPRRDESGAINLPDDRRWRVAGVGKFDGDSRDDVLLRHSDGGWQYHQIDGRIATEYSVVGLSADSDNLAWRLAGVGDLNDDGRDDALLRHDDGRWRYYPMLTDEERIEVELPRDTAWHIVGGDREPLGPNVPTPLPVNDIEGQAGTFRDAGERHLYRIDVGVEDLEDPNDPGGSDGVPVLAVYTFGDTDTVGRLLDKDLVELTMNDDFRTESDFVIEYPVEEATYYVEVSAFGYEVGNYDIYADVHVEPADHVDTTDGASQLVPIEIDQLDQPGTIGRLRTGDRDVFLIELEGSKTLTVYTIGRFDTVGRLLDADGEMIAHNDDAGTDDNFRIKYNARPGKYYIEVSLWGYTDGEVGYEVRLQLDEPDILDDGGNPSNATELEFYAPLVRDLSSHRDKDVFRVEIAEGKKGQLVLYTTGDVDTMGRLLDSNGNEIRRSDTGGAGSNFRIEQDATDGIYYLEVGVPRFSRDSGNYTVYAVPSDGIHDLDDSFDDAIDLLPGGNWETWLGGASDSDMFRIDVGAPGVLYAYTTTLISEANTGGALYDSAGNRVSSDSSGGGDSNFWITHVVQAGTYYLHVYSESSAEGPYTVHASLSKDAHGDTIATRGTALSAGGSRDGTLNHVADADFFRVEIPTSSVLVVYTSTDDPAVLTDLAGTLYDGDGTRLRSVTTPYYRSSGHVGGGDFHLAYKVRTGVYYIRVGRACLGRYSCGHIGPYTIHAPVTKDAHGDTFATATDLPLEASRSGALNGAGDVDTFRIVVAEEDPGAGTLTVRSTTDDPDAPADPHGTLYDADGSRLVASDVGGVRENFVVTYRLEPGLYYAVASVGTQTYRGGPYVVHASFSKDKHPDTFGKATELEVNSSLSGELNGGGDEDYFRIELTSAGTLTVYTTTNDADAPADPYGTLYDGNGAMLTRTDYGGDRENFSIAYTLSSGTYYIVVSRGTQTYRIGPYVIHAELNSSESGAGRSDVH